MNPPSQKSFEWEPFSLNVFEKSKHLDLGNMSLSKHYWSVTCDTSTASCSIPIIGQLSQDIPADNIPNEFG